MKWIFSLLFVSSFAAQAAKIAVIDSGLDTKHRDLVGNIWQNANESEDGRDNDGNGYQDDLFGWNFAEGNNQLIDYKYENTYTPEAFRFFDVQGRLLLGTATEEDIAWIRKASQDQEIMANLQKFGNFVHGTHVAGITVEGTQHQAMGVKLIPTEIKPFITLLAAQGQNKSLTKNVRMRLLKGALDQLAKQQMNLLEEIAVFVAGHKMDVANGSFGTGYNQAQMITTLAFKAIFFRDPSAEELKEVTLHFLASLIREGERMVKAAPKTIFVFAAGNDGTNNDEFPTSPTNIQAENVISVAATYDVQFLANFSNYGVKTVDVAAPGMLIDSAIPVGRRLEVSGTSQAAPYVAQVVASIKDANPTLTPAQVKKLLIGTVDFKDFLKGKILSQGIVNSERAVLAAQLSRSLGVDAAIARSRSSVRDREIGRDVLPASVKALALPLTAIFE